MKSLSPLSYPIEHLNACVELGNYLGEALALGIALELSRILQRDPLAPESQRVLQSHLQTAARACYRKHHSLFLGDRPKERSNSVNEHDDGDDNGQGRAVQVVPMKPVLKAPGSMLLKLSYDELLSSFALNIDLRRYTTVMVTATAPPVTRQGGY